MCAHGRGRAIDAETAGGSPPSRAAVSLCDRFGFDASRRADLLACLGLSEDDERLVEELQATVIEPHLEALVDGFYVHLAKHRRFLEHLPTGDTLQPLVKTMRAYLLGLGRDFASEAYFEGRLRVGLVHRRIELPLPTYQAAYCLLQASLVAAIPTTADVGRLAGIILRLGGLDLSLATEAYHRVEVDALAATIDDLRDTGAELRHQANTDPLTGVANRRRIIEVLDEALGDRRTEVAAMIVDLDHFKWVNDRHGHLVGDQVLREVVRRLADALRSQHDRVGRFGGEEFLVILANSSPSGFHEIAERLRAHVAHGPVRLPELGLDLDITVSIGWAMARADETPDDVVGRADRALYRAKAAGRNCVVRDDGPE